MMNDLETRIEANSDLWSNLLSQYSDKAYACFSDDPSAQKRDDERWANALNAQSVFTEQEVENAFVRRHNEWVASQK